MLLILPFILLFYVTVHFFIMYFSHTGYINLNTHDTPTMVVAEVAAVVTDIK